MKMAAGESVGPDAASEELPHQISSLDCVDVDAMLMRLGNQPCNYLSGSPFVEIQA